MRGQRSFNLGAVDLQRAARFCCKPANRHAALALFNRGVFSPYNSRCARFCRLCQPILPMWGSHQQQQDPFFVQQQLRSGGRSRDRCVIMVYCVSKPAVRLCCPACELLCSKHPGITRCAHAFPSMQVMWTQQPGPRNSRSGLQASMPALPLITPHLAAFISCFACLLGMHPTPHMHSPGSLDSRRRVPLLLRARPPPPCCRRGAQGQARCTSPTERQRIWCQQPPATAAAGAFRRWRKQQRQWR